MANTKTYDTYLFEQDYSRSTIDSYLRDAEKFNGWCNFKGHDPCHIDYKTCLDYVKEIQLPTKGKVLSKRTIKHHIGALKIYFNYLIDESHRGNNPMQNINIRGVRRSINHNLLEFEELEDLFYSYKTHNIELPNCPHVAMRDKVVIGFMIYQGMDAKALMSLKMEHLHLDEMRIYVPSTRKSNARELELKPPQMASLTQYLQIDRAILQDKIRCYTEDLFPRNSKRSGVLLHTLFKRLRDINYKVKDAPQIRASVITYWLKSHNIRKVQYMVGHRYISSTEKYLQNDISGLQDIITKSHPINL